MAIKHAKLSLVNKFKLGLKPVSLCAWPCGKQFMGLNPSGWTEPRRPIWIQLAIKGQRGKNKHFLYGFSLRKTPSFAGSKQSGFMSVSQNGIFACVCVCKCDYMCKFAWVRVRPFLCINLDWCGLSKWCLFYAEITQKPRTENRKRWWSDGEPDLWREETHKETELKSVNEKHEIGGREDEGKEGRKRREKRGLFWFSCLRSGTAGKHWVCKSDSEG